MALAKQCVQSEEIDRINWENLINNEIFTAAES